jgi:hypothetical protein
MAGRPPACHPQKTRHMLSAALLRMRILHVNSARNPQGLVADACRLGNCRSSSHKGARIGRASCRRRRHLANAHTLHAGRTRHDNHYTLRIRHRLRNRT